MPALMSWLDDAFDGLGAASVSRPARVIVAALVLVAVAFCVVVVVIDVVEGTTTSTEPLVLVIAGFPLVIGIAVVVIGDAAIRVIRKPRD